MFKPLNVASPQDLVALYEQPREGDPDATGGTGRYMRFSYPRFERLRAALGDRGSLAAMTRTANLVVRFRGKAARVCSGATRLGRVLLHAPDPRQFTGAHRPRGFSARMVSQSPSSANACGRNASGVPT